MTIAKRLSRGGARPEWITNNVLLVALIALVVYFAQQSGAFLTVGNLMVVLQNNATLGIVAVSLTFLVIAGGVDLSIGSTVGLAGTITALASAQWGYGGVTAIGLGLLAGAAVGLINGLLCGVLGFNPVIVTLGMLGAVRGFTLLMHHDQVFGLDNTLARLGTGRVAGIPLLGVIALVMFALGGLFLRCTVWGPYLFAIGANRDAAYLAGLPVRVLPMAMYVFSGLTSGLAGVLLAARLNGAAPGEQGLNLELQALTVVLLGGVAFSGGRGRLFGVLTGWVFLGVLENGLTLTNVSPFVETLVEGLALILAASLDALSGFLGPRLTDRRKVAVRTEPGTLPAPADSVPIAAGGS